MSYKVQQQEFGNILLEARRVGQQRLADEAPPRHLTLLYNPVSGDGTAKRIVDRLVTPVLRAAEVQYDVVPTQYAGYATEYLQDMNLDSCDGILIAGGDGLVAEVITGYLYAAMTAATAVADPLPVSVARTTSTQPLLVHLIGFLPMPTSYSPPLSRSNREDKGRGIPVGIIPSGTANALAHDIHVGSSHSQACVVGRAALNACMGRTRRVDVLKVEGAETDRYALSVMGWGLAGAVAMKAAKLRWIPGQKNVRYDLAGFVTMLSEWPVRDEADVSVRMLHVRANKSRLECQGSRGVWGVTDGVSRGRPRQSRPLRMAFRRGQTGEHGCDEPAALGAGPCHLQG